MAYYYLFDVFSIFIKCYFQVSFNLKVILSMLKITQNTVTEPLELIFAPTLEVQC